MEANILRIKKNISNLRSSSANINALFEQLDYFGDYLLIGGAVRDLLFNSIPRDYDIVVDTNEELFLDLPNMKRNSFGGIKVNINEIEFDIWSLNNTWALKKMQVKASKENLKNSCFFNLDSIIYDFKNEELIYEHFSKGLTKKTLDIIYEENPYPSVCVIRAFVLRDKWQLEFSKKLNSYIYNWYFETEEPLHALIQAQEKHYKEIKLDKTRLFDNLNKVLSNVEDNVYC